MDTKKLYRSRTDRMISGVCGGLAQYFSIDPTIVRLLVVLGAIASVSAVFWVYVVMMIVVPEEPVNFPPTSGTGM